MNKLEFSDVWIFPDKIVGKIRVIRNDKESSHRFIITPPEIYNKISTDKYGIENLLGRKVIDKDIEKEG